ncbi:MAG: alkaline phosphatase family protein, partial [Myxococcota bacterium]
MQQGPRVAVIGLDCGTPQLLFRDLIDEIPNIRKLMDGGMHGDLASITPPITVPAWACAMTGKTPGQLGLYGFRNRKDHTYDGLSIATSGSIHEPAVWDKLAEKGMRSLLIGVPPSFPPPKEFPGWRIGCFLTPPSAKRFAFP